MTRRGNLGEGTFSGRSRESAGQGQILTCSICLGELNCPVDTNCGHKFCSSCILTHWQHDRPPQPCRCPMCRRDVTLLLGAQRFARSNVQLYEEVLAYNEQMGGNQGGFLEKLQDLPMLLQHLRRDTFSLPGSGLPLCNKLYFIALFLALLVYVLSPIDLIPEGIFGIIGLADDVCLILCVVFYSTSLYRTFVTNLQRERT